MQGAIHVVVCRGDETGQELLDVALGVLEADVLGLAVELTTFDLSLESRRATANRVVLEAAEAMCATGLGLKAATITPPEPHDVGSPNRVLREAVKGTVIVRTGRRIPGVAPFAPVAHPISVIRMAVGDAYGAEEARQGPPGSPDEVASRIERITRGACHAVSEYAFRTATDLRGCVYGGRSGRCPRSTKGSSKRRWMRRPTAIRGCPTTPCSSMPPTPA